ncbi:hypothetical protein KO561_02900 [Radiobacillus kanasensis]|uniref:hypothetical protein n=1 Tax=Radiobacillus kanasensis TaxID=2844358 RepID=UPI001E570A80|nr:hypothetical protein [Radiobacillus kanasensis]UFT99929.1 hypothetical protein KO561_02900 [Radiobacillus kanasensis]
MILKGEFLSKVLVIGFTSIILLIIGFSSDVEASSMDDVEELNATVIDEPQKVSNEPGTFANADPEPGYYGTYYDFGKTSFSNYVWVRGGYAFYNLDSMDLEKLDTNQISAMVYDTSGRYYGKVVSARRATWQNFNFSLIAPTGRSYKIKLVNNDGGTADILQGTIYYN